MICYLILQNTFYIDKKTKFDLELGVANIMLIVKNKLPTLNANTTYSFGTTTNFNITNPPIFNQLQIDKYKEHLHDYEDENGCSIFTEFVICVTSEESITQQDINILLMKNNVFIILENVSENMKTQFNNHEPKVELNHI